MRFTTLARRSTALAAATALISSGGALSGLLAGTAFALVPAATVFSSTPAQNDNRSAVSITVSGSGFLSGDKIVLTPEDVQPWITNGSPGADATHEVVDLVTTSATTVNATGTSISGSIDLNMRPPGRYDVRVQHSDGGAYSAVNDTKAVLYVYDYDAANAQSVGFGPDATGSQCAPTATQTNPCARGAGPLDITGSNFARGADVQFLESDGKTRDTGLTFTPGDPGNANKTGYPSTTLIQGNYVPVVNSGTPAFVPGKHFLRVVNTWPSTSTPKTGGTTVEFWQPYFVQAGISTSTPEGDATLGQGAQNVTLTIKGKGIRPGSSIAIAGHTYNPPATPCSDITVGSATVSPISPADANGNDSQISATVNVAGCTVMGSRPVTINGPDGASFSQGAVSIVGAPTVSTSTTDTLGQGANYYAHLSKHTTTVYGAGFKTTPTCPTFAFGDGITATTTGCTSSQATVVIAVDPTAAAPGKYPITVTNPDGGTSTTAVNNASVPAYVPLTVHAGPQITSVSPTSFQPDGTTKTVTIKGPGFASDAKPQLLDAANLDSNGVMQPYAGLVTGSPTITQDTSTVPATNTGMTFPLTVASNAPYGRPVLVVLNQSDYGVGYCAACLGIDSLNVSPPSYGNAGSPTLTFTGTAISPYGTVQHLGSSVGANTSVTLTRSLPAADQGPVSAVPGSVTTFTCTNAADPGTPCVHATFDLTAIAPGSYDATIVADTTVPAAQQVTWTCTGCFDVNGSAPTNVAITPNAEPQGKTGVPVTITGQNLSRGMSVTIDSVTVGPVTFHPASGSTAAYLTTTVDVPSSTAPGGYDVTVTPADGNNGVTLTKGFTVNPAPHPTAISPAAYGEGAHGQTVTVTGTDFGPTGHVTLSLGKGVTVSNVSVTKCQMIGNTCAPNSTDTLTATVAVASDALAQDSAPRDVVVTNTDDGGVGTIAGGFTVDKGPKVVSVLDANGAPVLKPNATTTITVKGNNFDKTNGVTLAISNLASQPTNVTVVDAETITASVTVGSNDALGIRTVSVLNKGDKGYDDCTTKSVCPYVATAPGGVGALTLTPGAQSLGVRWAAAATNGAPISYLLAWAPKGSTGAAKTATVPGTRTTAGITGLTNGTTYVVSVLARNVAGSGPVSNGTQTAGLPASLTLGMSASKVTFGQTVVASGKLTTASGVPLAGKSIVLAFYPAAGKSYTCTATTSSTGAYACRVYPSYNTTVKAWWLGDSTYRPTTSASRFFYVATRVLTTSPANGSSSSSSTTLKISGNVTPSKAGQTVYLFEYVNGTAYRVASTTLTSSSTYTFAVNLARGTYTLRVYVPALSGNAAGLSAALTVYRT